MVVTGLGEFFKVTRGVQQKSAGQDATNLKSYAVSIPSQHNRFLMPELDVLV